MITESENNIILENNDLLWKLPTYFNIDKDKQYEEKLTYIMLKGLKLSTNPSIKKITLNEYEEGLVEDYTGMLKYMMNLDHNENNIDFTYKLIYRFFEFVEKKIEYYSHLINKTEYEYILNSYSDMLKEQGTYFEKHILIDDFENSHYFHGYTEEFIDDVLGTDEEEYKDVDLKSLIQN